MGMSLLSVVSLILKLNAAPCLFSGSRPFHLSQGFESVFQFKPKVTFIWTLALRVHREIEPSKRFQRLTNQLLRASDAPFQVTGPRQVEGVVTPQPLLPAANLC